MNIIIKAGKAPMKPPSSDSIITALPIIGLVAVFGLLVFFPLPGPNAEIFKLIAVGLLGALVSPRRNSPPPSGDQP